ncbi:NAD(P)-dependent oxidoreductase [Sphingomonas aracearum]|nr:NAD(P)-binding oxidoreductase [Sphingomonas aracearum]
MRIAVLGATGATGRLTVERLLAHDHRVVAVSRSPLREASDEPRLLSQVGDLTDPAFLRPAIEGCDAIISCLGQNRASRSLFARRTSPADLLRRVAEATITAIGGGPQHLIYMSAFGVGADRRRHALLFRVILRLSSIHAAYLDHVQAEAAIARSGIRWTIVRPPGLSDADEEIALVDKSDSWSSFETVSRRSVAGFLVRCAEQHGPLGGTITIGAPAS